MWLDIVSRAVEVEISMNENSSKLSLFDKFAFQYFETVYCDLYSFFNEFPHDCFSQILLNRGECDTAWLFLTLFDVVKIKLQ
jgi:hypothetical protein